LNGALDNENKSLGRYRQIQIDYVAVRFKKKLLYLAGYETM